MVRRDPRGDNKLIIPYEATICLLVIRVASITLSTRQQIVASYGIVSLFATRVSTSLLLKYWCWFYFTNSYSWLYFTNSNSYSWYYMYMPLVDIYCSLKVLSSNGRLLFIFMTFCTILIEVLVYQLTVRTHLYRIL